MKLRDYAKYILGALVTICFFLVLAILIFKAMPQENKDVLYLAIGALISYMGAIVNYYYGSSAGSAKKDETISNIATNQDEKNATTP
jgi:hypothetical protein